jgi:hypothetical protein
MMSNEPENFYFAVQYNCTHSEGGKDCFFIVPKEHFDGKKEEVFGEDTDDITIPAFLKKMKLQETAVPYLYQHHGNTVLVYDELLALGMEENDEIPEHLHLFEDIKEEESRAHGWDTDDDDYDRDRDED